MGVHLAHMPLGGRPGVVARQQLLVVGGEERGQIQECSWCLEREDFGFCSGCDAEGRDLI